jgi:hypothetical protein
VATGHQTARPGCPAARFEGSAVLAEQQRHVPAERRTDLVDDAGALAHQPLSHAVHRLKVQLIHGLGRNELHCRALHRFGMASASRKSFFCPFE